MSSRRGHTPDERGRGPAADTMLLDDEGLVDRVAAALAQRHPQSQRRGRLGTPAAVVLRMPVLKHLHPLAPAANGTAGAVSAVSPILAPRLPG